MTRRRIETKCKHCRGTGRVPLSGVHLDTLIVLEFSKEPLSGADVAEQMGISNDTACNRLQYLLRRDLVECRPFGRAKLWRVKA